MFRIVPVHAQRRTWYLWSKNILEESLQCVPFLFHASTGKVGSLGDEQKKLVAEYWLLYE